MFGIILAEPKHLIKCIIAAFLFRFIGFNHGDATQILTTLLLTGSVLLGTLTVFLLIGSGLIDLAGFRKKFGKK